MSLDECLEMGSKADSLYGDEIECQIEEGKTDYEPSPIVSYSRLRLIEPPWERPYLGLISGGGSYYPARLFSKSSKFIT